ncbi:hypothetical protein A3F45_01740 [Candidatus Curtissbacteria bacterium RIFCSPHIGHO2_12_FULL_41_17]|uniref:Baseplate protein J-like barrel domain-containing protein n=1 Tax=Candidatus Curtissbacteria bacterium RIFCSPHIGHO2_12_FULL_41_17 TaxID=1797722 RepID=A0A1F5HLZ4_9BACT|nr:MAG: hypothetical protein A3F45_01740 [Candidatus Curtissbacteria bacterium RIFCSPHIGHO2_12_FULL_41_17]
MKLPNLFGNFFKKTQEEETNYLSLILTPAEILASIWEFEVENPKIIGFEKRSFTTIDNLVHQAAVTIDKAASLAQSDVSKVTFGLSHFWLENGQLTKETAKILKTLSEDLELEAQAYISLASAINHLLKFEDSITPQAILIGNFEDFCEVHLLEKNQVIETKIAKGKVNSEKLTALISQFKKEDKDLPSRLIFYGKELAGEFKEDAWQNLFQAKNSDIDAQDEKSFEARKREPRPKEYGNLFIHEPKIEFLQDSQLTKAVALSQAQDILGHEPISKAALTNTTKIPKTEQFDFVEGEDVLLTRGAKDPQTEEKISVDKEEEKEQLPIERAHPFEKENYAIEQEAQNKEDVPRENFIEVATTVGWIPKLLNIFKNRPSAKVIAIILGALIVLAIAASFIVGQFLTTADITIKVQSKSLEDDFKTQVIAQNANSSQINGEEITAVTNGVQKAVATGKKKIGQAAKGEATIFNITSTPKTFPKGTVIITNSGLKFTLDEEVEATSAGKPGQPSTIKAHITASEVGPQYNLDLGQQLSFTQFDEYSYWAQNDAPFSGGEEKEVTVVSKDDLDGLSKSLKDTLTEKAKSLLKEKATNKNFDDQALIIKVLKSEFDKKPDEEASLVNLSMEIEASVIVYDQIKLKENLAQSLKDQVPENSQIRAQDIEILDLSTTRNDNSLTLGGKFKALLVPKFNEEELKGKITGKSQKTARSIIKEIQEVTDVEFKYSPNLSITSSIPRNRSKIKFNIEAI